MFINQRSSIGAFLALFISIFQISYGQSNIDYTNKGPGGVKATVWYKPDASQTLFSDAGEVPVLNSSALQQWNDVYGSGINLVQTTNTLKPLFFNQTKHANFHPSIEFNNSKWLAFTPSTGTKVIDRKTGSIHVAGLNNSSTLGTIVGFNATMNQPGIRSNATRQAQFSLNSIQNTFGAPLAIGSSFVAGSSWQNGSGATSTTTSNLVSYNGSQGEFQTTNITTNVVASDVLRIGRSSSTVGMAGQINEVVVFDKKLTSEEVNRVDSYFAIKYGITLGANIHYTNSNGTIIWNAQTNQAYHHNIAGIGTDQASTLEQKQSWSVNSTQEILISTTGLSNSNVSNIKSLENNQFLVWGDNNKIKEPTVAMPRNGATNNRLETIWKVQNTNQVGTIRVAWKKRSNRQWVLLLSNDEIFDHADSRHPLNQTIEVNGEIFDYVDVAIPDGSYFTLATPSVAPGGVMPAVWYRTDAPAKHTLYTRADSTLAQDNQTLHQWKDFYETGHNLSQVTSTRRPTFFNKTTLNNFHPTLQFNNNSMIAVLSDEQTIIDRTKGSLVAIGQQTTSKQAGIAGFGENTRNPGFLAITSNTTRFYTNNSSYTLADQSLENDKNFTLLATWKNNADSTQTRLAAEYLLNGKSQSHVSNNLVPTSATELLKIGNDGSSGYFNGQINEIAVFEHALSQDEIQRLQSYMAIKYGTSKTYANGSKNYINSNSEIIWDARRNQEYHFNLAGLAHDPGGGLDQKQAWSTHSNKEILIATTGLANTNAENQTSLPENQFLIWGDNDKVKEPIVAMPRNGATNYRLEAIWKVQNTNQVGTVRVAWKKRSNKEWVLLLSNNETFDHEDARLPLDKTILINGDIYHYADLTLPDSYYFTLATTTVAPGGVTPTVWYRTDAPAIHTLYTVADSTLAQDNQTLHQWKDFYETGHDFLQGTPTRRPTFSSRTVLNNFHPTLNFFNKILVAKPTVESTLIDRTDGSIFASGFQTTSQSGGILGFGEETRNPGFLTIANNPIRFYSNSSSYTYDQLLVNKQNFSLLSTWKNNADSTGTKSISEYFLNGKSKTHISNNLTPTTATELLKVGQDASTGYFNGQINEIAVFEHALNQDEIDRVQSYMAIKYGSSTMYANGSKNYLNSNSQTIWDTSRNQGYHFNIAGIGHDHKGALDQKQAWSTHTSKEVLIATTGLSHTNKENLTSLANNQFLIWGDNNKVKEPIVHLAQHPSLNYRFEAIWKVQNTNHVQTVRVAWLNSSVLQYAVMISEDEVFDQHDPFVKMSQTTMINGLNYAYADVILKDGIYFTIAATQPAPGGVMPAVWYRTDAPAKHTLYAVADSTHATHNQSVHQWKDFYETGHDFLQVTPTRRPILNDSTTFSNFHPTLHFSSKQMIAQPTREPTIIDRRDGSIMSYGIQSKNQSGGILGFGTETRNPGFLSISGNTPRLYTNGSSYIKAENLLADHQDFSMLTTWKNNADTTGTKLFGEFLLNGHTNTITSTNISPTKTTEVLKVGHDASTGYFNGQINEIAVFEHALSPDEVARVQSYMALKYGNSKTYANGSKDYLNANSEIVWNATRNQGYHFNIAGLALDEKGGLNQKQAWSTHSNKEILIATTGLTHTNEQNQIPLDKSQYFIWGDNNKVKEPIVYLADHPALNYRFEAIWKVQNTNNVQKVRIAWLDNSILQYSVMISDDDVFDAQDPHMAMNQTLLINGKKYAYADVSLKDGAYFTIAAAQPAPGGVIPAVWYRTDAAAKHTLYNVADSTWAQDNQTLHQWKDFYETGHDFLQVTPTRRPTLFDSSALNNFHPTLQFSNKMMTIQPTAEQTIIDKTDGTLFVFGQQSKSQSGGILGFGAETRNPGFLSMAGNNTRFYTNGSSYTPSDSKLENLQNFALLATWKNNGDPTGNRLLAQYLQNGHNKTHIANNITPTTATELLKIGHDASTGYYNGQMNEIALFEHALSQDELDRVQSYMAIKYGSSKTYANGSKNYINSSSEIVWDASRNAGFHYNIAGLAQDPKGGLNQKQAWSTHSAKEILIGTIGLASTNEENIQALTNGQFLIWGDNGLPKTPTHFMANRAEENLNYRFEAIWKVQNTNQVGPVRVAWPRTAKDISLLLSSDPTFEHIQKIVPLEQTIRINHAEYYYADVTLEDNSYFTIGVHGKAPGGIMAGLTHWYRADQSVSTNGQTVTSWKDIVTDKEVTQIGQAPLPSLVAGNKELFNYNPAVHFTDQQQMLGNLYMLSLDSTHFDIISLVNNGNIGNRYFSIGLDPLLGTSTGWSHPGLYTNGRVMRKSITDKIIYNGIQTGPSSTTPNIMLNRFTSTTISSARNGSAFNTATKHDSTGFIQGGHIFGANNGDVTGFVGHIGELMIFGEGNLSDLDRNKIESYLAIKYGITLNQRYNYISSTNAIIWNSQVNRSYHNNIAVIGTDITSMLSQKQTTSQQQNINDQLIISVGEIAADNASNNSLIPEGQFLAIGDNNQKSPMTNNRSYYRDIHYLGRIQNGRRMRRIWKAQNTNLTQEVTLRFPTSSVGTTTLVNDACAMNVIVLSKNEAFTDDVTYLPVTTVDGNFEVKCTFPEGYTYFTYARIVPSDPAYAYLPQFPESTNQYDSNNCVGEWVYFNKQTETSQKILALFGYNRETLHNSTVDITPSGSTFSNGLVTSKIMPRITTLAGIPDTKNERTASEDSTIVKIYYSKEEIDATHFLGQRTASWYFYQGNQQDILNDLNDDGTLNDELLQAVKPISSGTDDAVRYVEFANGPTNGSYIYLTSTKELILPVTLSHFKANVNEQHVELNWGTTKEVTNHYFEVQRSTDGKTWSKVGQVNAQLNGSSEQPQTYSLVDHSPATGINYYRLKQVDTDGTYEYSPVQAVDFKGDGVELALYPNPVTEGKVKITSNKIIRGIQVMDTNGKTVAQPKLNSDGIIYLNQLPTGIYTMVMHLENQIISRKLVIE